MDPSIMILILISCAIVTAVAVGFIISGVLDRIKKRRSR